MISLLAVVSMVCLLVASILLINLIQKAFDQDGVLWGMIAIVYPPGTYLFCRKSWDVYRSTFVKITVLLMVSLVSALILKFIN